MTFPFKLYKISGHSMSPLLLPSTLVLVNLWQRSPKIGDIAAVIKDGETQIKRITEKQGDYYTIRGDNIKDSLDSRSFGMVHKSKILGTVILY